MADYTVIKDSNGNILSITRNKDPKASIPVCEGNMDYQMYLEDLASGATVTETTLPESVVLPSTEDRLVAAEDMIAAIVEGAI